MALKIRLTKSSAGAPRAHLQTLQGLGLRKFGQVKLLLDTPSNRGMVFQVRHLVTQEVVPEEPKATVRRKPRHVRAREAARARRAAASPEAPSPART